MLGGLWNELGKKLAERWLSLLVLPGALYLAVVVGSTALGHHHPFDVPRLIRWITVHAEHPSVGTVGGQAVLLAGVLVSAAAAGMAAQAAGSLVERLALAADWESWPRPLRTIVAGRVGARRARWVRAAHIYHRHRSTAAAARAVGQREDPALRRAAHRAMNRVSPELPARPTWSGDRVNAVVVRLARDHHLDLVTVWPYLWLTLPDATRTELGEARRALARATVLTAWAILYLPLAWWWWPAVLISGTLALTGRARTRGGAATYALLLEAAARLYSGELAGHLGVAQAGPPPTVPEQYDPGGPLTAQTGESLTHLLHSSVPPLPPEFTGQGE
ncbi:hypothetical protein [Streptomyces sp. NPDC102282]|uniref:hypothetical protein n=1 Tax=Streptomyces sp. NPDC102282 TaxID=3366154 RepID=UPI0038207A19